MARGPAKSRSAWTRRPVAVSGYPDPVALVPTASAAYGTLTRRRKDETVLVTGAAGGVGTPAG
ncbi:hypothetical protein ACIBL6_15610 [Streptomyces sp. NPDC050400]|uniref:hypothetical protein n=1 Tax=Streptomyces sp. NPDC050400 TaxID=3365610 RepID=UPI00378AB0C6